MKSIKKISISFSLIILIGLFLFALTKSYIATTLFDTIILIFLTIYFNFNIKENLIFTIFTFISMFLLSLDIKNYFEIYKSLCYIDTYSIYPELILDILSLLNIPFCGVFELLHKNNILNFKVYAIIIYLTIINLIIIIVNIFKHRIRIREV